MATETLTHLRPRPQLPPRSRPGWTDSTDALDAGDPQRRCRSARHRLLVARPAGPHLGPRDVPRDERGHRDARAGTSRPVPCSRSRWSPSSARASRATVTRSSRASSPSRPRSGHGRATVRLRGGRRPLGRLDGDDRAGRPARARAGDRSPSVARPPSQPGRERQLARRAARAGPLRGLGARRRRHRGGAGWPDGGGEPAAHGGRRPHPREERAGGGRVAQAVPLPRPARPGVGRRPALHAVPGLVAHLLPQGQDRGLVRVLRLGDGAQRLDLGRDDRQLVRRGDRPVDGARHHSGRRTGTPPA